jgi:hypothetical protein
MELIKEKSRNEKHKRGSEKRKRRKLKEWKGEKE